MAKDKNQEFITGVWFAIDYLVRYDDQPSVAAEIASAAGISRRQARQLWKDAGIEGCDFEDRMLRFLKHGDFDKED